MKGAVLVVIGPSGTGKSALVRELIREGVIDLNPSWTDRPRRTHELNGIPEHRFVNAEEFSRLQGQGFFLEVVEPFGLPHRYGLPPLTQSESVPTIMVRAPMMSLVAKHFPLHRTYQIECGLARARARMVERGDDESELGARLDEFEAEARLGRVHADRIFLNDRSLEDLVKQVRAALREDFG